MPAKHTSAGVLYLVEGVLKHGFEPVFGANDWHLVDSIPETCTCTDADADRTTHCAANTSLRTTSNYWDKTYPPPARIHLHCRAGVNVRVHAPTVFVCNRIPTAEPPQLA